MTVVVTGLTVSQQRRFKALAKRVGRDDKAALLAMRVGLSVLADADLAQAPLPEVEAELARREQELDQPSEPEEPST